MHLRLFLAIFAFSFISLGVGSSAQAQIAPRKVLFLGNSITKHGPKADIDWTGNWGMAASAEEKDYVHLVTKGIAEKVGKAPEILVNNIADFERAYAAYDIPAKMKASVDFGADLIYVAIGENVPAFKNAEEKEKFTTTLVKLLKELQSNGSPVIVVRSCFWANQAKDEALKKACDEVGGLFVDINKLGKEESNYARSERPFKNAGVANHPGDKGMQAIADALVKAVLQ